MTIIDHSLAARAFATHTIRRTFLRSASSRFLDDLRSEHRRTGVGAAIRSNDTPRLFQWLVATLSYQGISDRAASAFMEKHGKIGYRDVQRIVGSHAACPKLKSHWQFEGCGYRKEANTCNEPALFSACGLPDFPLRNGRLNQTAVSLYLFIRDIAEGDLVGWVDATLVENSARPPGERVSALLEPMRHIFGVSDKVLSMLLSSMLLGTGKRRRLWFETGASFVAVDTLVHNYLHRTGVMAALVGEHQYGVHCYGPNGCAAAIQHACEEIDASVFNSNFPSYFPRLVQHALWRFSAQDEFDVCNGNRVDDRFACQNAYCPDFQVCRRVRLKIAKHEENRDI
jgi:hypothetical protein